MVSVTTSDCRFPIAGRSGARNHQSTIFNRQLVYKPFVYSYLRLSREGELDQVGHGFFAHLAGALEHRPLLDLQHRCDDVGEDLCLREELDPLAGPHAASQAAVDRELRDVDVGRDLRGLTDDELADRADLPLEVAIDAEGVLEGQIAAHLAPLVDEPVERSAIASRRHWRLSLSRLFAYSLPLSRSYNRINSSSDPNAISILPPRRRRAIFTRVFSRRESFSSASRVNGSDRRSRRIRPSVPKDAARFSV